MQVDLAECSEVTARYLTTITRLDLGFSSIDTLLSGDFSDLNNLADLNLEGSQLTTLPEGVFSGLNDLNWLHLHNNSTAPFRFTLQLGTQYDTTSIDRLRLSVMPPAHAGTSNKQVS